MSIQMPVMRRRGFLGGPKSWPSGTVDFDAFQWLIMVYPWLIMVYHMYFEQVPIKIAHGPMFSLILQYPSVSFSFLQFPSVSFSFPILP